MDDLLEILADAVKGIESTLYAALNDYIQRYPTWGELDEGIVEGSLAQIIDDPARLLSDPRQNAVQTEGIDIA